MTTIELIRELRDQGIRVTVPMRGDRILAEGRLTGPIRERIRANKPSLIAWLQGSAELIRRFEEAAQLTRKVDPEASRAWSQDAHKLRLLSAGERIDG